VLGVVVGEMTMGMLENTLRSARIALNRWLNQAEDPERVLEHLIQDMQDQLIQMRQAVAQAAATHKRLERQCRQAYDRAQEWRMRAEMALEHGDESRARDALVQRQSLLAMVETLEVHGITQGELVQRLRVDLNTLELKLADARVKRDLYVVRTQSAEASQRMAEMLGRLGSPLGQGAWEQMHDRLEDLEAQTSAWMELQRDPVADRFAQWEQSSPLPGFPSPEVPGLEPRDLSMNHPGNDHPANDHPAKAPQSLGRQPLESPSIDQQLAMLKRRLASGETS